MMNADWVLEKGQVEERDNRNPLPCMGGKHQISVTLVPHSGDKQERQRMKGVFAVC